MHVYKVYDFHDHHIIISREDKLITYIGLHSSKDVLIHRLKKMRPNCLLKTAEDDLLDSLGSIMSTYSKKTELEIRDSFQFKLDGSDFQVKVWNALLTIPWGQVVTYKQLATRIGSPTAVRAVANACGANPISVLYPCHRVVHSTKGHTGYGWGPEVKQFILRVEGYVEK